MIVPDASQLAGHARPVRWRRRGHLRPNPQSPVSNVMKNLSIFVGDLESLLLDRADDDGDRRSCLRSERRSAASRLEGCMSAMMHAHERSLSGRGVWCLTLSRVVQLE